MDTLIPEDDEEESTRTLIEDGDEPEAVAPARTAKGKARKQVSDATLKRIQEFVNNRSYDKPQAKAAVKQEKPLGVLGTIKEGGKSTLRALGAAADTYQGDEGEVVAAAKTQREAPKDPRLKAFLATVEDHKKRLGDDPSLWESIKAVGAAAFDNPGGAGLMVAEQIPNSIAALGAAGTGALVGGAVAGPPGAIVGGLAGLAGANIGLETGHGALEAAADGSFTPEEQSRVKEEKAIKGGVITGVDALTLGATKFITGASRRAVETATKKTLANHGIDAGNAAAVKEALADPAIMAAVNESRKLATEASTRLGQRIARTGGAIALETIGEGVGEYVGEFAATGKANAVDAVVESLAGLSQSMGEVAFTSALNKRAQNRLFSNEEAAKAIAEKDTENTGVEHEVKPYPGKEGKFVAVPKSGKGDGVEIEQDEEGNIQPKAPEPVAPNPELKKKLRKNVEAFVKDPDTIPGIDTPAPTATEAVDTAIKGSPEKPQKAPKAKPVPTPTPAPVKPAAAPETAKAVKPEPVKPAKAAKAPKAEKPVTPVTPPAPEQVTPKPAPEAIVTPVTPAEAPKPTPEAAAPQQSKAPEIRKHIEDLIRRHSVAHGELHRGNTFDKAMKAAKAMMAGEDVLPARFKSAAAILKGDKKIADSFTALHAIAVEAKKGAKAAAKQTDTPTPAPAAKSEANPEPKPEAKEEAKPEAKAQASDSTKTEAYWYNEIQKLGYRKPRLPANATPAQKKKHEKEMVAFNAEMESAIAEREKAEIRDRESRDKAAKVAKDPNTKFVVNKIVSGQVDHEISEDLRARVEHALNNNRDSYTTNHDRIHLPKQGPKIGGNNGGEFLVKEDGKVWMLGDNKHGWGSTMSKASVVKSLTDWVNSVEAQAKPESKPATPEKAAKPKKAKSEKPAVETPIPEEETQDTGGVDDSELKQVVREFNLVQGEMQKGEQDVTNVFVSPKKKEVVRLLDKVKVYHKDHGWMEPEEAKKQIGKWKEHAKAQGKDQAIRNENSQKIVLSLFDYTGQWSKPWEEAGYQVYRFDIQNDPDVGDVNNFSSEFFGDWFGDFEGQDVYAILGACPCTEFASSGSKHFAAKDKDGRTVSAVKLVHQTLATIEYFKPSVWAVENPVGRIEKLGGLPPWRLSFDPNHLGDPYTKKTLIWGRFNGDLPIAPVAPTEGSKMHSKYGGKSLKTKNARSATPEGFSYGFFMANNAHDNRAMGIANKFDRLDRSLIERAINAGVTEQQINDAVEDFYYMDLDDDAANAAIKDLIPTAGATDKPAFSRSTPAAPSQAKTDVEATVNAIRAQWKNAPEVVVIENMNQAPVSARAENLRQESQGATGDPEGFVFGRKVYLIASELKTPGDVVRVLLHESLGHFGLQGVFGQDLNKILKQVSALRRSDVEAKAKQYGLDINNEADRLTAAEEVLAELAQTNPKNSFVQRALAAIRNWLRQNIPGFEKLQLSNAEIIETILTPARQFVEQGSTQGDLFNSGKRTTRFSRAAAAAGPAKTPFRERIDKAVDSMIYNFQDRFKPLKDIQERSGTVDEDADAALAEERYSGMVRSRTDSFQEQLRDPLIKAIHDSGVAYEDVEEYLHALHAPSRNAAMREINPTKDELKAKTDALGNERDSLAKDSDVKEYLKLRKELRGAEADIEDGIADESLGTMIKGEIARLKKLDAVKNYANAVEKLRALRLAKPFDGDNTALSGMSDAESKAILAKINANGTRKALDKISAIIDTITSNTRQIYVDSGLEKADAIEAWDKKYQHYVPLHRDEVSGTTMPKIGQGFNIRGRESKRATGSNKEVTDILAHVVAQHEAAIIRSEKSRVDRALFRFAQLNPDPELWTLDDAPMVRDVDKTTGLVVERVDPTYKNKDEVLTMKIDGEEHTITFNDKNPEAMRLAASMKNLSSEQMGEVTQLVSKVTRFLATVNTTLNPVFTARNFLRDLQTAFVNLSDTAIADKKAQVFRDVPAAIKGMWNLSRGKKNSQWAKYAAEFQAAGGQTGWMEHYKDIGSRADSLKKELAIMQPGRLNASKRTFKAWLDIVQDANNAIENATRLSSYVQARKSGISEGKAAQIAKNLTVNFNARGAKSVELNAWYMFLNASIQGTARLIKALSNKQVRTIVAGVIVSGFLMDVLARSMAGDDDDDGENDYDQLPEHTKAMNFVLMVDGRPVTIPMPYGYNFFASTGRKMSEMIFRENYSAVSSATDLAGVFLDAFSPTGQAGSALQYVAPTVADPFVQWAENKNFAGNPLRRAQNPFGVPNPEYQMGFKSTSAPAKWLAEVLNDETGGNEVRPGYVNINPAFFDFAVSSVLGGAGRTYLQAASGPMKAIAGDDVQAREVPFLNIFLSAKPEFQTERKYFEAAGKVELAKKELKTYREKGDTEMIEQIREEHAAALKLEHAAKETKKLLERLRKRDLLLDKRDPENKRELRKAIEDEKRQAMSKFNKLYVEATSEP